MAQYRYQPDYQGMRAWLVGAEARGLCVHSAEQAAAYATTIAPVGSPPDDQHPGLYRDSIHVDPTPRITPARGRFAARVAVSVVADAPYAAVLEVQQGHHTLRRAAEHVGDIRPPRGE